MLWGFLTFITFGIFGLWVPIKKLKWQNKNTHIKVVGEFVGTYIDVFGSSDILTIDNNGKVTISGRVVTNNLSSIIKQSDGSYSCTISGGKIIIYPVGVKSSQGNSNKVRINVLEYGGALCFEEE